MPHGLTATLVTDALSGAPQVDGAGADPAVGQAFAYGLAHFARPGTHVARTGLSAGQAPPTAVDPTAVRSLAHLLAHAEQPVVVLGSRVWTARATGAAVEFIRTLDLPAFADGAARGSLPPGDPHHFLHSRAYAFAGADVILLVGAPFGVRDFHAGYGRRLSPHATVVQLDASGAGRVLRAVARAAVAGAFPPRADRAAARRAAWLAELRSAEQTAQSLWLRHLASDASPVHPFRLLAEIDRFLTEDSVFIADDPWSAELAGRVVRPRSPGYWMDPRPLGTAGVGIPFALAARESGAGNEYVVLCRDAPYTSADRDFASSARRGLPVIGVVAHTGAAPFLHQVRMHGGHGEDVRDPAELRPALERARACGRTALIGVRIDPDAYLPGSVNQPWRPHEPDQPGHRDLPDRPHAPDRPHPPHRNHPTHEGEQSNQPHRTHELRNQ